jgi:uncharacterized protein (DUF1800 family)
MLEHILRRMAFGASPTELAAWADMPLTSVITSLLNYESMPNDVDTKVGDPAYAGITAPGRAFSPDTNITDTRQRWLFRMLHTRRPLEEKMALFWHNHFATAYSKVGGTVGGPRGTRLMDGDPRNFNGVGRGQIDLFRQYATGNFRDLLVEVAKDPAMVIWLDGRTNTRQRPQENFGREIMELFTMGIGNYTEQDVYAAARVFTGYNIEVVGDRNDQVNSYYRYIYRANDHDPTAKEFTFAIYPDGSRTIPARPAAQGEQDGVDFINALARHPATARRLATKLYKFFISEMSEPDPNFIEAVAQTYLASNFSIKAMLQRLLVSEHFLDPSNTWQRYAWPVEFTVRAIKETGWQGFSVNSALTPLSNMGQSLYEPPDVAGWDLGPSWISTTKMLTRMNFAATLAANQRFNLARDADPYKQTPEGVLEYMLGRFQTMGLDLSTTSALGDYLRSGAGWTGSSQQLQQRAPGLARLIMGCGEYQFN